MGKYFVNEVKYGISEGGVACGPVEGTINVSLNVKTDEKSFWITNSELTGIPNFYLTDDDIFDKLIKSDISDDFIEFINDKFIDNFEGISLGDYDNILSSIKENVENPAGALIRYIILLTRCPEENINDIISIAKGNFIDDIDIPKCDIE